LKILQEEKAEYVMENIFRSTQSCHWKGSYGFQVEIVKARGDKYAPVLVVLKMMHLEDFSSFITSIISAYLTSFGLYGYLAGCFTTFFH
jgi:hypothetical protein